MRPRRAAARVYGSPLGRLLVLFLLLLLLLLSSFFLEDRIIIISLPGIDFTCFSFHEVIFNIYYEIIVTIAIAIK